MRPPAGYDPPGSGNECELSGALPGGAGGGDRGGIGRISAALPLFCETLRKGGIKETKEQLKGSFMLGLEGTSSRMMSIGKAMLLNKKVKTTEEILKAIDDVDKETINKVIDKIFNIDKLGLCIVGRDVEEIELIK